VRRPAIGVAVCFVAALAAAPAAAQFPLPLPLPGQTYIDPQDLQRPRRAPFTLTPSITFTEEYNDNTGLDNSQRDYDFVTGFTPALAVNFEDATRRLNAVYSFTAEVYARGTQDDRAFDRQSLIGDALWRVTPQLTLTAADTFAFDTNTNLVGTDTVSTGRDQALSNSLSTGAIWDFDSLHTLRGGLGWTVQRFDSTDAQDSDVYRAEIMLDRRILPQLTGTVGYEFEYFDIQREELTYVHTPRIGATWTPTPTIALTLSGGPSIEMKESSSTRVTPAVTAAFRQRLPFGAWGLSYDRGIGTAGGLGGTTDNQFISGFLDVLTLARGLVIQFAPRYAILESPRDNSIDVRSFTMPLQAVYRITPYVAFVAGYQFFRQRSDSTIVSSNGAPLATDADQNRVYVGVQFGYPIRFD
jgi:hypothetical protein